MNQVGVCEEIFWVMTTNWIAKHCDRKFNRFVLFILMNWHNRVVLWHCTTIQGDSKDIAHKHWSVWGEQFPFIIVPLSPCLAVSWQLHTCLRRIMTELLSTANKSLLFSHCWAPLCRVHIKCMYVADMAVNEFVDKHDPKHILYKQAHGFGSINM